MLSDFTHKGWFGICPCYFSELESQAPNVEPRFLILYPVFWVQLFAFDFIGFVMQALGDDYEYPYPLRITGKINKVNANAQ